MSRAVRSGSSVLTSSATTSSSDVLLWIIAFLFVIYFAIEPVERLLGV